MNTIQDRLQALGISQNALARGIGSDSGTVSRVLRGIVTSVPVRHRIEDFVYRAEARRDRARQALVERPRGLVEQDDIDRWRNDLAADRDVDFDFPWVGELLRGYRPTDNLFFVDSSGFGQPGERALTAEAFVAKLRPGFAYAVVRAGQFQVYIQEFHVKGAEARRTAAPQEVA